ncbi:hypothetical protein [Polluticaenibacter yanchengensis]|uniref:hypothetical protein n=1 Tax=Polluticaenibacter yanchengensis TaxID=3014562 RepID=UPI00387B0551
MFYAFSTFKKRTNNAQVVHINANGSIKTTRFFIGHTKALTYPSDTSFTNYSAFIKTLKS